MFASVIPLRAFPITAVTRAGSAEERMQKGVRRSGLQPVLNDFCLEGDFFIKKA
jgi:hypothetical protein